MSFPAASSGLLLLLTTVSGVWLSHAGRPLNTLIFTIHKLVAVGTFAVIAVNINGLSKTVDIGALLKLVAIPVTGLLLLTLFVSGVLLSFERSVPEAALLVHRVAPLPALLVTVVTIYLLVGGRS